MKLQLKQRIARATAGHRRLHKALRTLWHLVRPAAVLMFRPSRHANPWVRYSVDAAKVLADVLIFATIFVWMVYVGVFGHIPTCAELARISNPNASEVYTSDGVLMGRFYVENRVCIDSKDISPNVINALVATEDSRFFEHGGIDMMSMARVLFRTVLMADHSQGGGSTISQQLAKNLFPRRRLGPFTIPVAKVRELIIAHRIERTYTKEEILTLYLNTVPFGENVYGIEAASKLFFSRKCKWLEPPAAATLVGMLAANTAYNPRLNPERSLERRNVVLRRMAQMGYIDSTRLAGYQAQPLGIRYNRVDNRSGLAPHFRDMLCAQVRAILADLYGDRYDIYTDGLKIVTTINSRLQTYAERAVSGHMERVQKTFDEQWRGRDIWAKHPEAFDRLLRRSAAYRAWADAGLSHDEIKERMSRPHRISFYTPQGWDTATCTSIDSLRRSLMMLNAGFVAMHPQSGKVMAWVGGVDYRLSQLDYATTRRQVGSTFKPILYATALMHGISACTYVENVRRTFAGGWSPGNADGRYGGFYSLKGALCKSLNTVSAWLMDQVGPDAVVQMAHRMGIEQDIPSVPSIALGTAEISLCEMVTAYTTFPNYGSPAAMQTIVSISDADGNELYRAPRPQASDHAMTDEVAAYMIDMMRAVVDSGTARSMRTVQGVSCSLAGKTGTTQNGADGWFIAYTPNLVAGAWVGGQLPVIRFRSSYFGQGAYMALPIVGRFLHRVQQDPKVSNYTSANFDEVDDNMAIDMNYPMHLDSLPDADALLGMAIDRFVGADATPAPDTLPSDTRPEEPERPIRSFFRRIFGRQQE